MQDADLDRVVGAPAALPVDSDNAASSPRAGSVRYLES